MVLYFSGTGNSRYVAGRVARALGEPLCSLNERIKAGDYSPVETGERLIVVTPTYAWRIPRLVGDWLQKTKFPGAKRVWFLMTCGSEIGNAEKYNRALSREMGLSYMGTAQVVMPENYIALFRVPGVEESRQIVARAESDIDRAIAALAAGEAFAPPRNNLYDRVVSGPVNPVFYALVVKDRAFAAGAACTGCGRCAQLCPTNNIVLRSGKPVWGGNCTHCMACISYCPTEAIEYGKKSVGKPRYRLEAL